MSAAAMLRVPQPSHFEASFCAVAVDGITMLAAVVDGDRCLSMHGVLALLGHAADDGQCLRRALWTARVDLDWYLVALRTPGVALTNDEFIRSAGLRAICKAFSQRETSGIRRWLKSTTAKAMTHAKQDTSRRSTATATVGTAHVQWSMAMLDAQERRRPYSWSAGCSAGQTRNMRA